MVKRDFYTQGWHPGMGIVWLFKGLRRAPSCARCYDRIHLIFERESFPCLLQPQGQRNTRTICGKPHPLSRIEGMAHTGGGTLCGSCLWSPLHEKVTHVSVTFSAFDYVVRMSPWTWLGIAIQILFSRITSHSALPFNVFWWGGAGLRTSRIL